MPSPRFHERGPFDGGPELPRDGQFRPAHEPGHPMSARPLAIPSRTSFPLVPEEVGPMRSRALVRAITARTLSLQTGRSSGPPASAEDLARRHWPRDATAAAVLKAATGPA